MKRTLFAALGLAALLAIPAFLLDTTARSSAAISSLLNNPPGAPYVKVSQAVKGLPDFIPTMGETYVSPKNPAEGPYLGYSRDGKLIDTVYMIPIKDFDEHAKLPELVAPAGQVDHVGIYFNPGHAGMPVPHYHIVLWHVPKSKESLVSK
jgi:hypothetical protein